MAPFLAELFDQLRSSWTAENPASRLLIDCLTGADCNDLGAFFVRSIDDTVAPYPQTPVTLKFPFQWLAAGWVAEDISQSGSHLTF